MKIAKIVLLIGFVISANADYVQKSPNIILDTKTNFLWQDTKDVSSVKRNFKEASSYCKSLEIDGVKGWELPNMKKLFTIVDTKKYNPTIDKSFKYIAPDTHWTSRLFATGGTSDAYTISFQTGSFFRRNMEDKYYLRCVKEIK